MLKKLRQALSKKMIIIILIAYDINSRVIDWVVNKKFKSYFRGQVDFNIETTIVLIFSLQNQKQTTIFISGQNINI